ncbi:ammonium transporter [Thermoanaerobacter wiegelii]|uniref:Ammonium transporter n=1 Tax=Thermoanaerobacter wiegelii Rt8.B1 TaxID=697303 RepID=G2MSU9_9THEO|nr:ammonium transporter [Thermoanaerobacter wiegelii]AEM78164.1 ammonium transporter [Thermoanaerobacter wiegelii Rt8.B1]
MVKKIYLLFSLMFMFLIIPKLVFASTGKINTGDTAFVLFSAALVMIMTPGLAFFYGGMVSSKNVISTMMQSFIIIAIVSIQWILFGFSLSFGSDVGHIIGNLQWLGLKNVGFEPYDAYSATIPFMAFMIYQLMFAIITPALITGAFAERMRFGSFLLFTLLWTTLVYDPIAHWVWGNGGWLKNLGALDFAGGTVVHISSGISGLIAAILIGKRKNVNIIPHNIPMVIMGTAILWFGWFGFNAGSALAVNGIAVNAFVVTNTAAAAAALGWVIVEWKVNGKPTLFGAASGAVAGLVAITPAAGYVTVVSAIIIGAIAGILCYFSVNYLKHKFKYDDSLDAFGIHGIGGTWGAIATGIFATKVVNPAGANGLIYGNVHQFIIQIISVIAVYAFASIMTYAILKFISLFMDLRVSEEEEESGLDISQHGEGAYNNIELKYNYFSYYDNN